MNCTSPMAPGSLLKNAILAFFNLARVGAKLLTARKITTYVVILASLPCDAAACFKNQQAPGIRSLVMAALFVVFLRGGFADFSHLRAAEISTDDLTLAREILSKARSARINLPSGRCTIQLEYPIDTQQGSYEGIVRTFDLSWEGGSLRSIVQWEGPTWSRKSYALVHNGRCFSDDGGNTLHAEYVSIENAGRLIAEAVDPRLVGYVLARTTSVHRKLNDALHPFSLPSWLPANLQRVSVAEADRYEFTYDSPPRVKGNANSDVVGKIVIAPEFDFNIVSASLRTTNRGSGDAYERAIQCEYSAVPLREEDGDIETAFFPERVVYTESVGDVIRYKELLTIRDVELNAGFPEDHFTIPSLGIAKGRHVLTDRGRAEIIANTDTGLRQATRSDWAHGAATLPGRRGKIYQFLLWGQLAVALVVFLIFARSFPFRLEKSRRSECKR